MKLLLLVFSLLLMVSPDIANPTHQKLFDHLKNIFDLARKHNESNDRVFVEDLSHLAEPSNGCKDQFFCKTYYILMKHQGEDDELVRNIKIYINTSVPNCTEPVKNATSTVIVQKPLSKLLQILTQCIQRKNLGG